MLNGKYWHNKKMLLKEMKLKNQCKEKGIGLLIIKEEHWINNKNKCLSKILYFINN